MNIAEVEKWSISCLDLDDMLGLFSSEASLSTSTSKLKSGKFNNTVQIFFCYYKVSIFETLSNFCT